MTKMGRARGATFYNTVPSNVACTQIVEWSIKTLSKIIESDFTSEDDDFTLRKKKQSIVENFCSIPGILKTVLLIREDFTVYHLLESLIFQRSLLNIELVDTWLVEMLEYKKLYGRVFDYLGIVSNLMISKSLDLHRKPQLSDHREFFSKQEKMIDHIASLDGFLSTIFKLNQSDWSRACSTSFMQRILDK